MNSIRVLVVEDMGNWQNALPKVLERLGEEVQVTIASDYDSALQHIAAASFDLAVVDLALQESQGEKSAPMGMDLLRELRVSRRNQGCGLIVLTGYPTLARTRRALIDYAAYDFIDKSEFNDLEFVNTARAAILDARLRQSAAKANERYRLTILFGERGLKGSELTGPDRRSSYTAENSPVFDLYEWSRRASGLSLLRLKENEDVFRHEARSIGLDIFHILEADRRILGDLIAAQALAQHFSDLWIQFSGPPSCLRVPFELLRDEDEYLGLSHILTRRAFGRSRTSSRKPGPFNSFISNLVRRGDPLRILFVEGGSNALLPLRGGINSIVKAIQTDLEHLGLANEVTLLSGEDANYEGVSDALSSGRYHIFHYAGHSRAGRSPHETGGLLLRSSGGYRAMSQAELNLLCRDTELQMVYLDCALDYQTVDGGGPGIFESFFEALSQADVPIVLGYRWVIDEESADRLGSEFYSMLWRTFSAGEALLHAKRSTVRGRYGKQSDDWAAPVLLMQND